jgi:hypothetical protein
MAETTPTQPPDADMWSDADISVAIGGNVAMPVGAISPRLAWAISGSADIAIATPNASAKAPARSMYLVAPNAFISCQIPKFAEFALPPQGRDARRWKTRVVHYLS